MKRNLRFKNRGVSGKKMEGHALRRYRPIVDSIPSTFIWSFKEIGKPISSGVNEDLWPASE